LADIVCFADLGFAELGLAIWLGRDSADVIAVIGAVVVILTLAIVILAVVSFFDRKVESITGELARERDEHGEERRDRLFGAA
jgi:hypothetical protein